MTDGTAILIAVIAAIPPTMAATVAVIAISRNSRKLEAVKVEINGRMTELLKAANAQGHQDERDDARGR